MVAKEYYDCFAACNFLLFAIIMISAVITILSQWKPTIRNEGFIKHLSEGADECGTLFFMIFLLHATFGTYIMATTLQYLMVFFYFIMCAFPIVHRGDPIKRTIGVIVVSGFLIAQGMILLINQSYYA